MPAETRQFESARAALRLVAAVASNRTRQAEKIILTAPHQGELAYTLATLLIRLLANYGTNPTQFVEAALADVARAERASADA